MTSGLLRGIAYSAQTLWLFTVSDHKTFMLPEIMFGCFGALSNNMVADVGPHKIIEVLQRLPLVIIWTWLNTLVFTLSNQGTPAAVTEDSLNKPWRPIVAGRITLKQSRRLQLVAIPAVMMITYFCLGAFEETTVNFCLTWMYNDLGGSDEAFVGRNLIIAAAYGSYGRGALRVATGAMTFPLHDIAYQWIWMTSAVVFTTIPVQDLKDQTGDLARGRRTAPLVIGEDLSRWSIAFATLWWSMVCAWFWQARWWAWVSIVGLGLAVAVRVVLLRGFRFDRATWRLWSYWLLCIYFLPVCRH